MITVTRPSLSPTLDKERKQRHGQHQRRQHHRQGEDAHGKGGAPRRASEASPIAAMVPTIADITPTLRPMIMLFENAGRNCGCWIISTHQRSDRPSMGKLVSAARGEGKDHQQHDRRQQEDDQQHGNEAPTHRRASIVISGTTKPIARLNSQMTTTERREHDERHGRAERPVEHGTELRRDQIADERLLAADQERGDVVAGGDQERKAERGDDAGAAARHDDCRKGLAAAGRRDRARLRVSMSLMPRIAA